ncbi:MAG: pyridoxamine 5'-phosphate oxidase family protein [Muribaculaceae bacterium]|nr:pyridoxamine 5'-phosphate oxidase family protein [Muribaculaceae bacterium]
MMEKKMRRHKQMIPLHETKEILMNSTNGILSLVDIDEQPYGVPLSFAYDNDTSIYIHSASAGHKIDCINHNPSCCFTVVAQDDIVPEEFTTYFRSVIVKGKIHKVDSQEEMLKGLLLLCEKYSPGIDSKSEISKCMDHVAVFRIDIEDMKGKEAIELVRARSETFSSSHLFSK